MTTTPKKTHTWQSYKVTAATRHFLIQSGATDLNGIRSRGKLYFEKLPGCNPVVIANIEDLLDHDWGEKAGRDYKFYEPLGYMVTTRVYNRLTNNDIKTLDQIRALGKRHFIGEPNCGPRSIKEIGDLIGEDWGQPTHVQSESHASLRITRMIEELRTLGYTVIDPKKTKVIQKMLYK